MNPGTAISVRDVTKRFRVYHERNQSLKATIMRRRRATFEEFLALDGVSFDVEPGTTLGIIGENGSGKSTLLKCMARILEPDAGAIETAGSMSALLELGAGFHPELSGRENVFLNASILGLSRKEVAARFDDIVRFAGLERFIDSPVKNYSSGMYVRLGFSVAINVEPDILLVDEILAVGDQQFQEKCFERFADLRRNRRTVVLVSHSLETVRNLCTEVLWLDGGQVRSMGGAGEVVDAYLAAVHGTGEEAEELGRWGSGEVRYTDVELLGPDGTPTRTVKTGDPVSFRMKVKADPPVRRPVFGFGIYRIDGIHVTGPNTKDSGHVLEEISGEAVVELKVDRLLLLPGTYDVAVSCYDETVTHAFDFIQRAIRFDVEPGHPVERHGVTSLGGAFSISNVTDRPDAAS